MASTPKPVKLAELLQKQQEPFVLEVYLSERGYLRKSSSTNSNSRTTNSNSNKKLTRSSSWGNLSCPKILRSVYKKLVSRHSETTSIKGCEKREGESNAGTNTQRSNRESGESDRFSSASSRTQYDSCTEGEKESTDEAPVSLRNDHDALVAAEASQVSESCNMKERETVTDRTAQRTIIGDSPFNKITEDDNILWELLFHPPFENPTASGVPDMLETARPSINPSPHFAKSKRVLQQTRQLLFDCVREMTENHAKKLKEQQQHNCDRFLGAEEIGKLVYEKLGSWESKQAGHQGNVNFLLESDLLASAEEWGDNYQERREIGSEIGDAILQDIIKDIF